MLLCSLSAFLQARGWAVHTVSALPSLLPAKAGRGCWQEQHACMHACMHVLGQQICWGSAQDQHAPSDLLQGQVAPCSALCPGAGSDRLLGRRSRRW